MTPREFYAEEIDATCGLTTPALARAFATVPREEFVGPGPWMVQGGGDLFAPARRTADADPRRVYHNLSIAIDPGRQLYNGAPGVVAPWLDAPALGQALRGFDFMTVRRLRRDPHEKEPACRLHGPDFCLSR